MCEHTAAGAVSGRRYLVSTTSTNLLCTTPAWCLRTEGLCQAWGTWMWQVQAMDHSPFDSRTSLRPRGRSFCPSLPYGYHTLNTFLDRAVGPTSLVHDAVARHIPARLAASGAGADSGGCGGSASGHGEGTDTAARRERLAAVLDGRSSRARLISKVDPAELQSLLAAISLRVPESLLSVEDGTGSAAAQAAVPGIAKRGVLCKSVGGLWVQYVLVSNPEASGAAGDCTKPVVAILARQHPGETVASFVVEGVLAFLVSADPEAAALRDAFDFHVFPMVLTLMES